MREYPTQQPQVRCILSRPASLQASWPVALGSDLAFHLIALIWVIAHLI
jgi:hypothetical protein